MMQFTNIPEWSRALNRLFSSNDVWREAESWIELPEMQPWIPKPPNEQKTSLKQRSETFASPRQLQLQTCRDPMVFQPINKNVFASKGRCLTSRPTARASTCIESPRRRFGARVATAPSRNTGGHTANENEDVEASSGIPKTNHVASAISNYDPPHPPAGSGGSEKSKHWYVPAFYFGSSKRKLLQGPQTSTSGDVAYAFEPNPTNPNKIIASKKYFAPKGFGTLHCKVCSRSFLNKELLGEHERSQYHQDRLNATLGTKEIQNKQKQNNTIHLHEFDAEYFEFGSDSDGDVLVFDEPERIILERIRVEKTKFFDFVRDFEEQKYSQDIPPLNKQLHFQCEAQGPQKKPMKSKEIKNLLHRNSTHSAILDSNDSIEVLARIPSPVDERVVFLQKCQELNIAPSPCLVTRRRENAIDMTHYGAGDKIIQAVASSLKLSKGVQILSFKDNCIGEQGCIDLMEALRQCKDHAIHKIDLSHNQIGLHGAHALQHTMQRLTYLDLSCNRLGDNPVQAIMDAVTDRSECLRTLILKDNAISSLGGEAIAACLRSNKTLTELDLSWNAIRGKGAGAIGSALNFNHTIRTLDLAWNGIGGSQCFDSWANFFESNTCLSNLNLRHNNLDERNALIITENIRYNETITKLNISENPLGPTGGKLVFKLMDSFGANRELVMENCNFDARSKFCNFDPANPQGKYALDLGSNYERSIAKALVRIAGHTIQDQMKQVTLSKKKYDVGVLKGRAQNTPRHGLLELEFYKLVVKANKTNVISNRTLNELQAVVSSERKSEMDRLAQMTTLAEEMALSVEQLGALLEKLDSTSSSSHLRCSVVVNLFSRLVDRAQFAVIEKRLTKEEQATVRRVLGELYYFNEENPTAHYRLNLDRKYDRSLANKILELNNEERVHRMKHSYADTSQKGNMMNFRNETLNGIPFTWNGAWTIPKSGVLEFDYVSVRRPTPFNHPIELYEMGEFLSSLAESESDTQRLDAVRQASYVYYFTTDQICQILRKLVDPTCKVEVAVILHPRVTDLENYLKKIMELLRNRGHPKTYGEGEVPSIDDDHEVLQILRRIGWLNIWNPLDPDVMYRLDLSHEDENIVTQCLVALAVSEPGENWDGESIDGREFELPSTWIKAPPKKGFLEVHYRTDHVSEETVKSKLKRGDNFGLRVQWLKRTLIWEEPFKVIDQGFQGNDRAAWGQQRSWEINKPLRLHQLVETLPISASHDE